MAYKEFTTLVIDGLQVEVTRKRMKRLILRIDNQDGHLRVSCPKRTTNAEIESFVRSKRDWIDKHAAQRDERSGARLRDCVTGEELYLWGRTLSLEVAMDTRFSMAIHQDRFGRPTRAVFYVPPASSPEERREWLRAWYKQQTEAAVAELVPLREEQMQLFSSHVGVRWMKSRWGSCSVKSRRIRFNSQLAKYPREYLDYVVVHELAHIAVPNHGPDFQALMDRHYPGWRKTRDALNATTFAYYE